MENAKIFDSEFCTVQYMETDHVVLLAWKKACSFNDYRSPSLFMLWLLEEHPGSTYVVDARNGFEDEKEDVDWAFAHLIPLMAATGCKTVVFIMNPRNDIEGEMDMWGNEFRKYFQVFRVTNYTEALAHAK
ncbi:MAG: hypothetical protein LUE65_06465 [Clostridiales bacterium]|nr:hypothetical protein [Clostridiales bacterium]